MVTHSPTVQTERKPTAIKLVPVIKSKTHCKYITHYNKCETQLSKIRPWSPTKSIEYNSPQVNKKKQKDKEEEIEKNLNSSFFLDISFKTGAKNNMECNEIFKLMEDGNFIEEYESNIDEL